MNDYRIRHGLITINQAEKISSATPAQANKKSRRRKHVQKAVAEPIVKSAQVIITSASMAKMSSAEIENAAAEADKALDNFCLRYAKQHPATYLKIVGHLLVMSEMIAMMTPAVAMGIQWVTALCSGPPVWALVDLFYLGIQCAVFGNCQVNQQSLSHCIIKF